MTNFEYSNFEYTRKLLAKYSYMLPDVVMGNADSRNRHQPVTMNEQGVALCSGCTPRIFSMVAGATVSPMMVMMEVLKSEQYAQIST